MSVTALFRRSRTSAVLSLAAGLAVSSWLTGCANGPSGLASGRLPYKDAAGDGDPFLSKEMQTASNGKTSGKPAEGSTGTTQGTQQTAYRDGRAQTAMTGSSSGGQNPFAAQTLQQNGMPQNGLVQGGMPQNGLQPPVYGQPGSGQPGSGQPGSGQPVFQGGQIQQVAYTPNNGYPAGGSPQAGGYPQGAYPPGTFPDGPFPPEQSLPQSGVTQADYAGAAPAAYPPGGGYPQGADPNAMAYAAPGGQQMSYAVPAGQPYAAGPAQNGGPQQYSTYPPQQQYPAQQYPAQQYPPQQYPGQQYPPQQFAPQYGPAGGTVQTTSASDQGFVMPRSYAHELGFPPAGSQPPQTTTASNDEFLPPIR